jgi:phenylacetate-CoA ligase
MTEDSTHDASLTTRLWATAYTIWQTRGAAGYPFKPLANIEADRDRRMRAMVAYAYRWVPYYRETMDRLGLSPNDFQWTKDLSHLPLLDRSMIQRDPEYYVSSERPLSSYLRIYNSGSTARPCEFYYDLRSVLLTRACASRSRAVWAAILGRRHGYRQTQVMAATGSHQATQAFLDRHTLLPPGIAPQRQLLSVYDPPEHNFRLMNEFKPDLIFGFGSQIAEMFRAGLTSGATLHRPRLVVAAGDPLPEAASRQLQQVLGIPVLGQYGAVEAGQLGFECPQRTGYHMNTDFYHVRIVDSYGQDTPPGESGEVLVSNLINHGTVWLNYRLSDIARMLPWPCPCGRSLPLLSHLEGRIDDWVELPSGQLLHPQWIASGLRFTPGLWAWQLNQVGPGQFRLSLTLSPDTPWETAEAHARRELVRCLGESVRLDIVRDQIQRTPAGKVRPVISLQGRARLAQSYEEELGTSRQADAGSPDVHEP